MKLGYIVGDSTPFQASFISKEVPRVGEYVIIEYNGMRILGMIKSITSRSVSISDDIHDPRIVEKIKQLEGDRDFYVRGVIKILGQVETLENPRIPPPPGTEVYRASKNDLTKIFSSSRNGIRIGVLAFNPDVPVYVDVNKMVSRHLAILAITGAGKSNTVAVISDGILGLGGTVLIFDMHSEYVDTQFKNGKVNLLAPKLNPLNLHVTEFLKLMNIEASAYKQEYYFRKALNKVKETIFKNHLPREDFFGLLRKTLEDLEGDQDIPRSDRNAIASVLVKLDSLLEKYGGILDPHIPPLTSQLKIGCANVVDLGSQDEEAIDVIVSHYLRTLLYSRKSFKSKGKGLSFPLFIVLEEAHILAPRDRNTLSKYWISRIAREGRKFGLGLCLVSQRPKSLDSDTLSQANNMIVLRLVEPTDQRYVQQASETLSEDLLEQLSSLNVGEAIVLGLMVKIPAIVKIDLFEGKLSGGDLDIVGEWKKIAKAREELEKSFEDFMGEW